MQFTPIKTRKFLPPKDDLYSLLDDHLSKLKEKDILLVTSKIVSISQGRCVKIDPNLPPLKQKIDLIKEEADGYLKDEPHGLTLKDLTLTPYAGIDRSNANNHYILWPKHPHKQAKKIWQYLRKKHSLKDFGVIITDSFCLPLRWGHYGISIGFYGFHPNYEYENKKDIFGEKILAANSNFIDAISALGGTLMGEGNEQTPLLLVRDFPRLKFTTKDTLKDISIPLAKKPDFYTPLLKVFKKPKTTAS